LDFIQILRAAGNVEHIQPRGKKGYLILPIYWR